MEEKEKPGEMAQSRRLIGRKKSDQQYGRAKADKFSALTFRRSRGFGGGQKWIRNGKQKTVCRRHWQVRLGTRCLIRRSLMGKTVPGTELDDVVEIRRRGRLRKKSQCPGDETVMMGEAIVTVVQH
jgi:hypothetical protein